MNTEKCFTHLNGYEVKDAKARKSLYPFNLGAFVAILNDSDTGSNKSDAQIRKNIDDLVNAGVKNYAICVEVMPTTEEKNKLANGEITSESLTLSTYPSAETMNTYFNIAKEKGLKLSVLKFHCLWANQVSGLDYNAFIKKYKEAVINALNKLTVKPKYVTVLNESGKLITSDTKSSVVSLLGSIKALGYKVGVCGVTQPLLDHNLVGYIDMFLPHFYPFASLRGEKTTVQDVEEGFENSRVGDSVITYLKALYPDIPIIISEVGASSYWEALAQPEKWWGGTSEATYVTDGTPMALYTKGAIRYFSQYEVEDMYIFWTDTIPSKLAKVFKAYYEKGRNL